MNNLEKLTKQEEEAMLILWKLGEGTISNILDALTEPKQPYTTLASTVKNLDRKNYLKTKRYGNVNVYSPAVTEEVYKKHFMGGVVENYFQNSYKAMVSFFAEEENISTQDLQEIIDLIEKRKK